MLKLVSKPKTIEEIRLTYPVEYYGLRGLIQNRLYPNSYYNLNHQDRRCIGFELARLLQYVVGHDEKGSEFKDFRLSAKFNLEDMERGVEEREAKILDRLNGKRVQELNKISIHALPAIGVSLSTMGREEELYDYDANLEAFTRKFTWPGRDVVGVVTVNSYNALVLNTFNMLMIDIDYGCNNITSIYDVFALLSKVADSQPGNWRLYSTAKGARVIEVSRPWNPLGKDTLEVMELLSADPDYIRLCQEKACFRARLTPKPWRFVSGAMPRTPVNSVYSYDLVEHYLEPEDEDNYGVAVCSVERIIEKLPILDEFKESFKYHTDVTRAIFESDDLA